MTGHRRRPVIPLLLGGALLGLVLVWAALRSRSSRAARATSAAVGPSRPTPVTATAVQTAARPAAPPAPAPAPAQSGLDRARDLYGAHPLHLLGLVASFALTAYAVTFLLGARGVDRIAIWFVCAVIAHDLVLFPLYALADRLLTTVLGPRAARGPGPGPVLATNFVRLPAMASGLLLLIFFPAILRMGESTYLHKSGLTEGDTYLHRWLLLTVGFFVVSAVCFAVRRTRQRSTR